MGNKSHFFRQSSGGVIGSPFLNFRFEESITDDNTVIDNIGGLNATLTGVKIVRENTGAIQRGYKFNGSSRVNLVPTPSNYPFCIKYWANLNNNLSSFLYITQWNTTYGGLSLIYYRNRLQIGFGNGGTPGSSSRKTFETSIISVGNEWKQFVIIVKSDFDFDLYIDGVIYSLGYSEGGSATSVVYNNNFEIGKQSSGISLDEFTMFNQELTPEEILEIYNKESNGIRVF